MLRERFWGMPDVGSERRCGSGWGGRTFQSARCWRGSQITLHLDATSRTAPAGVKRITGGAITVVVAMPVLRPVPVGSRSALSAAASLSVLSLHEKGIQSGLEGQEEEKRRHYESWELHRTM